MRSGGVGSESFSQGEDALHGAGAASLDHDEVVFHDAVSASRMSEAQRWTA